MQKRLFNTLAELTAWKETIDAEYAATGMNIQFDYELPDASEFPVVVVYTETQAYLTADGCGPYVMYDAITVGQSDFNPVTE